MTSPTDGEWRREKGRDYISWMGGDLKVRAYTIRRIGGGGGGSSSSSSSRSRSSSRCSSSTTTRKRRSSGGKYMTKYDRLIDICSKRKSYTPEKLT